MFYICSLQTTNILYVHILKKESVFHYHSAKAFIDNPRQSGGFILQKKYHSNDEWYLINYFIL